MKRLALLTFALVAVLGADPALGYPLDGYEQTGIQRLEAYRLAQDGKVRGRLLPPGARLPGDSIALRLIDHPNFQIPAPDAELEAAIRTTLGDDVDGYALAVLDLTNPLRPRYAAHNSEREQNPASVGKLMVALGWFQTLADVYPNDTRARHELMKNTRHQADAFIRTNSHKVPFWKPGDTSIEYRGGAPLHNAPTCPSCPACGVLLVSRCQRPDSPPENWSCPKCNGRFGSQLEPVAVAPLTESDPAYTRGYHRIHHPQAAGFFLALQRQRLAAEVEAWLAKPSW